MEISTVYLSKEHRRQILSCNRNYSREGIYHPDRILEEYDLLYLLEGTWDIWEEDTCFSLRPNQVLLLSPGLHHYSLEKCSPGMKNLYIHFSTQCEDSHPESDCLCINKLTDVSKNHIILHYFEEIIETYWSNEKNDSAFRLAALLDLLLAELSGLAQAKEEQSDLLVTEIIHRFYCCPDRFFSPEELAKDYHISLRTLSNRFKKNTGRSIHQYQLKLKLDMAYDVLPLNPGRGLRDIALSFGFYDEFQFSKLFKRQFGISPSVRRSV